MQIIEMNTKQIKEIHKTRYKQDFPKNERRPLNMILKAIQEGKYLCLGLEDEGDILGYAWLVKTGDDYLFDYLAIEEGRRNQNLGSNLLRLVGERLKDARSVIGEVEDPEFGDNPDVKALRARRYGFYMRNGIIDTGLKAKTFGVDFLILRMDIGEPLSDEEYKRLYLEHYRAMLPKLMFEKQVHVKEA